MKKFVLIFTITILLALTIIGFVFVIKYKKQIQNLNFEITKLNTTISKISSENNELKGDKEFTQKQYQDLKSIKKEAELIDVEIQKCMKFCNYTTACMNNCVYDAIPKLEKEIDKNIKLLEKVMNKEQIVLLHDSQKKWIIYKEAQQKLNNETIGTMMGTMYTNILASEQIYLIELRAKELDSLYHYYSEK